MKATPREPAEDSDEHASPIPSTSKAPEHSVNFLPMMPHSSEAMSIPSGLVASAYRYRLLTRSSSRRRSHSHAFFVIPPNSKGYAQIATPRRADSAPSTSGRAPSTVTVRKGAISVGQDGILRGDWQSPRVPVANRHAAFQAAPQKHNFTRSRY
jgi:hypothetical protein